MQVLVAGVGNIFLSDDGFGSAVLRALSQQPIPVGTTLVDFGVSSVHLAFELMNGYDALILVDTVCRGGTPGTLYVIEPELSEEPSPTLDPHAARPESVLSLLTTMEHPPKYVRIIGCEPASLDEGIGLTHVVAAAVERATELVLEQVREWFQCEEKGGVSCLADS